jgi:signal transduction histidine kinase
VFNPLKNLIQKGIDRALFPERLGVSNLFFEGSNKLSRASNIEEIADYLLKTLPAAIGIEKAALTFRHQFSGGWEVLENPGGWISRYGKIETSLGNLAKEPPRKFWDLLGQNEESPGNASPPDLRAGGATAVFPLRTAEDLWGFYLLGNKSDNRLLTYEEIHIVENLCSQAAHLVGNARLLEGLQKTNRSLADLSNRLIQAEKMADLGEGAATLAHELKTPLGILRGSAEIMLKSKDPNKKEEVLRFILEEVDRLTQTVDDFLRFARMSPPAKTETDVNNLVQSAAFLWESKRKNEFPISLQFQLDPRAGKVFLDSRQVYQVLLNIFANAEEAMSGGGDLKISTAACPDHEKISVTIQDSGKGIPPENLPKVFDRFFTTKETGLGLGLAIVKKIVEAHEGEVKIDSPPGNGTRVAIVFPAEKKPRAEL